MLTGDEIMSSGNVWIRGKSMKTNMVGAQKSIGYCPQFDALLFDISGRENLKIFSLMRGIPRNEINSIIEKISNEFGFQMHLDKKIKAYSGGNKRKISAALVSYYFFFKLEIQKVRNLTNLFIDLVGTR